MSEYKTSTRCMLNCRELHISHWSYGPRSRFDWIIMHVMASCLYFNVTCYNSRLNNCIVGGAESEGAVASSMKHTRWSVEICSNTSNAPTAPLTSCVLRAFSCTTAQTSCLMSHVSFPRMIQLPWKTWELVAVENTHTHTVTVHT